MEVAKMSNDKAIFNLPVDTLSINQINGLFESIVRFLDTNIYYVRISESEEELEFLPYDRIKHRNIWKLDSKSGNPLLDNICKN